jgi:peptidoglycan-associated lipoprotein
MFKLIGYAIRYTTSGFSGLALITLISCAAPKQIGNTTNGRALAACDCGESDLLAGFEDRVFFDFNKSNLSADALVTLRRQVTWLDKFAYVKILVAGNADERGTETYNLALGARRAVAVQGELEALGIAGGRIETISYGKDCPVAPGDDPAALQQNRNAITSIQGSNPQNCH